MPRGTETAIRSAFAKQATWCRELGSPFMGLLMEACGRNLTRATGIGQRILDFPGSADAQHGSLPLRLAAGLHALVRRGHLPDLARFYPPNPQPNGSVLWSAVEAALANAERDLLPWLDTPPQTNEVGRAAILMAGLMTVAAATELPIALYEAGSSAGLNLILDRYAYRLGPVAAGTPGSILRLDPNWHGPAPPDGEVRILSRRGADLNPLDPANPIDRERLLAYIWPDQIERLARTQAALLLAAQDSPPIDRADAANWLEARLHPMPEPGVARILMHSITFQYFPPDVKTRVIKHVSRLGAAAREQTPFAWLRFEADERYGQKPSLLLTLWPGGTERHLATGDAQGRQIDWKA